jgi:hypothetical protein
MQIAFAELKLQEYRFVVAEVISLFAPENYIHIPSIYLPYLYPFLKLWWVY